MVLVPVSIHPLAVSYLFGNIAYINLQDKYYIYWYGGFVFLSVYALTELMDRNKYAPVWEVLRCALGLWFIYDQETGLAWASGLHLQSLF